MLSAGTSQSVNAHKKGERAGEAFLFGSSMSYKLYEYEKALWLRRHPDATPSQIMRAYKAIARRLGL